MCIIDTIRDLLTQKKGNITSKHRIRIEPAEGMSGFKLSKLVAELPESAFMTVPRKYGNVSWKAKKAILRVLADHYPNVWPGVETIALKTGFSERQVQNGLSDLEMELYISPIGSKLGGRNFSTQYELNIEAIENPEMSLASIVRRLYPLGCWQNPLGWVLAPYGLPNGPEPLDWL